MKNLYTVLEAATAKMSKSVKGNAQAEYKKGNSLGRGKRNKMKAIIRKRLDGVKGVKRHQGTLRAAHRFDTEPVKTAAAVKGRTDAFNESRRQGHMRRYVRTGAEYIPTSKKDSKAADSERRARARDKSMPHNMPNRPMKVRQDDNINRQRRRLNQVTNSKKGLRDAGKKEPDSNKRLTRLTSKPNIPEPVSKKES